MAFDGEEQVQGKQGHEEDEDVSRPLVGDMVSKNRLGAVLGGVLCGVGAAAFGAVHSAFMSVAMAIGGGTIGAYIGGMFQEEFRLVGASGRSRRFLRQRDATA